jgi:hypothetical protein
LPLLAEATEVAPSRTSVLRWLAGEHITGAAPCHLIEETASYAVLYEPAGTTWMREAGKRSGPRGRNLLAADRTGRFEEHVWVGDGVLRVHSFGEPWSVWRWLDSNSHWSPQFYLNLEDPWRRTPIGFDTGDWVLDVFGVPDNWAYKDVDELEWLEATGQVSPAWAERTRSAGRASAAALDSRAWPFSADWNRWLPDVGRGLPELAANWADVDGPGDGM